MYVFSILRAPEQLAMRTGLDDFAFSGAMLEVYSEYEVVYDLLRLNEVQIQREREMIKIVKMQPKVQHKARGNVCTYID